MTILQIIEKLVDTSIAYLPRHRPHVTEHALIQLVAHRGAHDYSLGLQENTDAAFERALHLGCYGIELDVRATADGVLIVNHDPTLKRLWGHNLAIHNLNLSELRTLVPSLPTLAEVVAKYGKQMHLFIEIKAPFVATQALADTLQTLIPGADYHLLSLDDTVLADLVLFPKESRLLVPEHNNVNKLCKLSLQENYGGILGHYLLLRNQQIKSLQAANQLVGVGFVDSKFSLYRELNRGIRLLFTNNATTVTRYLQELRTLYCA